MKKQFLILIAAVIFINSALYGIPVIKAEIDQTNYNVGEQIRVSINVTNPDNTVYHGLFFKLSYDPAILAYDGIDEGNIISNETRDKELLYAVSDPATSAVRGNSVVVSYALTGSNMVFSSTGELCEIKFRVIGTGNPALNYNFIFKETGMRDGAGNPITATWINSNNFKIGGGNTSLNFIKIVAPYENQVFFTTDVLVNAILTNGSGYSVILQNLDTGYKSASMPSANGSLSNKSVPINYGFNRIKADLYDANNLMVASDTVKIFKSQDDKFIKIIKPLDHALVNTDSVDIKVASSYANVTINGTNASFLGEKFNEMNVYWTRIWLKKGFNKITASVKSPENAIYTDAISVYYEKDDSIFKFITPLEGQIFKAGTVNTIKIKGEISSLYNDRNILNTITVSVYYYPKNRLLNDKALAINEACSIVESDISDASAPYMFVLNRDISLKDLETGDIRIVAWKNKDGSKSESEINRYVNIDSNRLWIELVQPNIYSEENIDSMDKLEKFNNSPLPDSNIEINNNGNFSLKSNINQISEVSNFNNHALQETIETPDGSLYAMYNENGTMYVFKKDYGKEEWNKIISRSDMYGYSLCYTSMGILLGVSNLFTNQNSGLYLIKDNSLVNITLGEPLPHVQFILNKDSEIYLYGNNFSHLYSFNIFSLQEKDGKLSAEISGKISFNNNLQIKQFGLNDKKNIAFIRTIDGNVFFYTLKGDSFIENTLKELTDKKFLKVSYAIYPDSDYNVYLLYGENDNTYTVMENKYNGELNSYYINLKNNPLNNTSGLLNDGDIIYGIDARGELFHFIIKSSDDSFKHISGRILFDAFYKDYQMAYGNYSGYNIDVNNYNSIVTDSGSIYLPCFYFTDNQYKDRLFKFTIKKQSNGVMQFAYNNQDIEGIKSFSFMVDARWMDPSIQDVIKFGFSINNGESISVPLEPIKTFIEEKSELYNISSDFDVYSGKYLVTVEFNDLQKDAYVNFNMEFSSIDDISPEISNLTIYNKIIVKVPRPKAESFSIPINGFIYDQSVSEAYINGIKCGIQRDRSFSYNYEIKSNQDVVKVNIDCINSNGKKANLNFLVNIFDSTNDLWDVSFKNQDNTVLEFDNTEKNLLSTNQEILKVSGYYYGLIGVVAGYEQYSYVYENNIEKLVLINRGLLNDNTGDAIIEKVSSLPFPIGWTTPFDITNLNGYEYCKFTNQKIKLYPGRQRLILYVENPGGLRTEYKIIEKYPDVVYNLPIDKQKIIITNDNCDKDFTTPFVYNNITFEKRITVDINETKTVPYKYVTNMIINGEVKALSRVYELRVVSFDSDLKFDNGTQEVIIPVDEIGKFSVNVNIDMSENCENGSYRIGFIPTAPYLNSIKTGLLISANKDFSNSFIIPDFSLMSSDKWDQTEIDNISKELRLKFNRFIPSSAKINLVSNYDYTNVISGQLVLDNSYSSNDGYKCYYVVDENSGHFALSGKYGIKNGYNRVQWRIYSQKYKSETISSSSSGNDQMEDFVFNLTRESLIAFNLSFNIEAGTYYNYSNLPQLSITKPSMSKVIIYSNDKEIINNSNNETDLTVTLQDYGLNEGWNNIVINYTSTEGNETTKEYSFLYDNIEPIVYITSYKYDDDFLKIKKITARIDEANIKTVSLFYNSALLDIKPSVYQYLGNNIYEVTWDNLDSYPYDVIIPDGTRPMMAQVIDKAGNQIDSDTFIGVSSALSRPQPPTLVRINLDTIYYQYAGSSTFDLEQTTPYHAKYYSDDIDLSGDVSSDLNINRPGEINADFKFSGNKILNFKSNESITLKEGFSIADGCSFNASVNDSTNLFIDVPFTNVQNSIPFLHDADSNAISFVFWFRYEHESYYKPLGQNEYHRILTLYEDASNGSLYLAYNNNNQICLIKSDSEGTISDPPIALQHFQVNKEWNLVIATIDINGYLTLSANNNVPKQASIDTEITTNILKIDASYYFGDTGENNGHFSIKKPFYSNSILNVSDISQLLIPIDGTNNDIPDLYPDAIVDVPVINNYEYHFNSLTDKIADSNGEPYYNLMIDNTSDSWFCASENSNYNESNSGSLRATAVHYNYFTPRNDNNVIFRNSTNIVCTNSLTSPVGSNAFRVTKQNNGTYGRYYFGNTFGSNGLKPDNYYSITGKVEDLSGLAKLVVEINGKEQTFNLQKGEFHFVYQHDGVAPNRVVIYLQIENNNTGDAYITLNKNMVLNEGNYSISEDLKKSNAKTKYFFQNTGTVSLWYKPLNVNEGGFVNYDAVIFDSDLVTIGTKKDNKNIACYYFTYKHTTQTVQSNIPVRIGWQYIQFSYNMDGYNSAAYLYVNDEIAGKIEGLNLSYTTPFNDLTIGSDSSNIVFAEGYIDDVSLSSIYSNNLYVSRDPVTFNYDDINKLNITSNNISYSITNIQHTLTKKGNDNFIGIYNAASLSVHGINFDTLSSGIFNLKSKMMIGNYHYENILSFTKDDRPEFILRGITPFIIYGNNVSVFVDLEYDNSYIKEVQEAKYAGFRADVVINNITRTYYITQDYLHQNLNNWIILKSLPDGSCVELTSEDNAYLSVIKNRIVINIKNLNVQDNNVNWSISPFYFQNLLNANDFNSITATMQGIIDGASLNVEPQLTEGKNKIEYRIKLEMNNQSNNDIDLSNFEIKYKLTNQNVPSITFEGSLKFNANVIYLYYDDIFKDNTGDNTYGKYNADFTLTYNGINCDTESRVLDRQKMPVDGDNNGITKEKTLSIIDFSVLYIDKKNNIAQLILKYDQNNLNYLYYAIATYDKNSYPSVNTSNIAETPILIGNNYVVINNVKITEGITDVYIDVYDKDASTDPVSILRKAKITISNSKNAPEVIFTNNVQSLIGYNNVFFSWKGYYEGQFNNNIEYSYNFDNKGWTAYKNTWRSLDIYNLSEGYHCLKVKAMYNGVESSEISSIFFVDVNKPVFDKSKIRFEKALTEYGICEKIRIIGDEGAVIDASLKYLYMDGRKIELGNNGSFTVEDVDLNYDGNNQFLFTAYDKVGNFTDYAFDVDNTLTNILFPVKNKKIIYAPMTVIGKVSDSISIILDIYLFDAMSKKTGDNDYSGWKKAKTNEDRTFFIDNIFVNPGSSQRDAGTELNMVVVLPSGKVFKKNINVNANEIIKPIDMSLSTHAEEGENANINVVISCKANVDNISSWSIDFDGDGIYDMVDMIDNPSKGTTHNWEHSYSTLGFVKPKVRVITNDGNYFTASDEIIIHEKIKEASNVIIQKPIGLSVIPEEDGTKKIFVLSGEKSLYKVQVFQIGRNDDYISNRLFEISLDGYGIENPVSIKALDANNIFIAYNKDGEGYISLFRANEFGNYLPQNEYLIHNTQAINKIDSDDKGIYATFENKNTILFIPIVNENPDLENIKEVESEIKNSSNIGSNSGISREMGDILLSDYYNQRIVKLSDNFKCMEYFGNYGNGEGEFFKPSIIKTWQNRIFVYDESRYDIQVFGPDFNTITTLKYSTESGYENYFESGFLLDIADIGIITKEENNKIYYYALILSKSTEKLAMIRLPQWEELRAKVRNNKIVFIKDQEVFTAKPDGSDLSRIISSDSIPRIEGKLDYPALSPDGKTLVFTSRTVLYNGQNANDQNDNNYAYDNLYVINVDGTNLTRIPLGVINNYEIERPVFNSNGDKIIFSAKQTGKKWQIYVYDFESGSIKQLFVSNENARYPYFSPDDRFIVFTTDYDSDEEIEIFDTLNPTLRVSVTSNNTRDSYPVWNTIYPFEISNQDLKIESKISFVSERNFHKGIYYVYLSRKSPSDIRIVKKSGEEIGDNPDLAAIEVTTKQVEGTPSVEGATSQEGDYPAFTGDGKNLVFEYYNGIAQVLKKYDYVKNELTNVNIPSGSSKPAGMKNMIANFNATAINGDQIKLSWSRYTDQDIFYTVRFRVNKEGEPFVQKKVFTQEGTTLEGMEMGVEYLYQVCIIENGEEVTSSQWKKVKMPEVSARPSYTIDQTNPYIIKLHAWKPLPETAWTFSWIIDNQEINYAQNSQDFVYEFPTSGLKNIVLKASNKANTYTSISEPMPVNIISDIIPVFEPSISSDVSTLTLDCTKSSGNKIDWANTVWNITGAGQQLNIVKQGSIVIVDLNGFKSKLNINLTMKRIPLNGMVTDILEKNRTIDLTLTDVIPVITYDVDQTNQRIIRFFGDNSIGNIDWTRAKWEVFADGNMSYRADGVSTFAYQFPENNNNANYSIALTIPRKNDGITKTSTIIVNVEAAPIEPVIDYEIITLKEGNNITGAKVVFSCQNSKGNNIDFMQAKWSLPVATNYNEQANQIGPTAIYNLPGIQQNILVEVSLTLPRKSGTDVKTVTKSIIINSSQIPSPDIIVNKTVSTTNAGNTIILDVLSSKGVNIDWEKTDWLLNGQYSSKGPVARLDIPESAEDTTVKYVCTVYVSNGTPIIKQGVVDVKKSNFEPFIEYKQLNTTTPNVYELSVLNTSATNIDWEKTMWYIYDGNESVIQKQGSKIMHTFVLKSGTMGYPVMVNMYKKGSSTPFMGYQSIDVEGDEFKPLISYDTLNISEKNVITFSAEKSPGSNIDWANAKWTFGDSSEAQYGTSAVHKYPYDNSNRKYTVSLSLTRRLSNGQTEAKTLYQEITIGSDEVKPIIYAKLTGSFLVLSSERSQGRGLMLDRSLWVFAGAGDNVSYNSGTQTGVQSSSSVNNSFNISGTTGISGGTTGAVATVTVGGSFGNSFEVGGNFSSNNSDTFSSSNIQTGAICRKTIINESAVVVSLFVYRVGADGNVIGKSITVTINLNDARNGVEVK